MGSTIWPQPTFPTVFPVALSSHSLCSTSSCGSQVFPDYWTSHLEGPKPFQLQFSDGSTLSSLRHSSISPTLWSHSWQRYYPLKAESTHPSFIWSQSSVNSLIMTFNTFQNKRICKYLTTPLSQTSGREGWYLFISVPSPYLHSSHLVGDCS